MGLHNVAYINASADTKKLSSKEKKMRRREICIMGLPPFHSSRLAFFLEDDIFYNLV